MTRRRNTRKPLDGEIETNQGPQRVYLVYYERKNPFGRGYCLHTVINNKRSGWFAETVCKACGGEWVIPFSPHFVKNKTRLPVYMMT